MSIWEEAEAGCGFDLKASTISLLLVALSPDPAGFVVFVLLGRGLDGAAIAGLAESISRSSFVVNM